MLSQKEIEYLRSPESFNSNYKYFLKHQIKNKVQALSDELVLLSDAGFLNSLSEKSKSLGISIRFLKTMKSLKIAPLLKIRIIIWWGSPDLNRSL